MYYLRPANQRGETRTDWLESRHTFSFGNYYDPKFMGFSDLRVINDDIVGPGGGFGTHPHDNMEILTFVLNGQLEHKDSLGNGSVLVAGEIQRMSAGHGILHSEFNPSLSSETHFLQVWIIPNIQDTPPTYEKKKFDKLAMTNNLTLVVSSQAQNNAIIIQQDAQIYQTILEKNKDVTFHLNQNRAAWVQLATGSVALNDQIMIAGDGLAIFDTEETITIRGIDDVSNVIVFNLKA